MLNCKYSNLQSARILKTVDRFGVGYDYIRSDSSGGFMRLDVRSQLRYVMHLLLI